VLDICQSELARCVAACANHAPIMYQSSVSASLEVPARLPSISAESSLRPAPSVFPCVNLNSPHLLVVHALSGEFCTAGPDQDVGLKRSMSPDTIRNGHEGRKRAIAKMGCGWAATAGLAAMRLQVRQPLKCVRKV
jgi:hypothetical protein